MARSLQQLMSFSPGTRLWLYDGTSLLGEGGRGQVWQATDTQLNRQVALKILSDAFADDPARLARFQREAQVLASHVRGVEPITTRRATSTRSRPSAAAETRNS